MTQLLFIYVLEIRLKRCHYETGKQDLETEINTNNAINTKNMLSFWKYHILDFF